MHLSGHDLLLCLCVLLRSCCLAFNNDATELLSPHDGSSSSSSSNNSARSPELQGNASLLLNRARTGGRGVGGATHDRGDKGQIGCRELRSTKYISDGHCTSLKPIKELVCAGECLPTQLLPNWIGGAPGSRLWGKRGSSSGGPDWRCVTDKTRTQRIQLQCQDGSTRTYKITVVTSCKCKRYSRQHNQSGGKFDEEEVMSSPHLLHKHQAKSKRRLGKRKYMDNWHEP
ncbi:hypothetical protein NL108_012430 [Boleophthalmus pectinirostris]|uniref:sclerostin domain-containing protein 1a n=1 Tax=Boleophthalmus pectinirostris TaxID=150288 RepID=UPI002431AE79|nr:sclerostin domain-containing protein 1a [Boleophthalmus pectinirostris]KAJ0066390.1 hypothetical protein NL108_012430 [Boleophthalmus pectinirostris]